MEGQLTFSRRVNKQTQKKLIKCDKIINSLKAEKTQVNTYLYKRHHNQHLKMDLLSELQHAEFKEAFDEFDKVSLIDAATTLC